MSVEIKIQEPASPNGELVHTAGAPAGPVRLPIVRQRRYQLIALLSVIALVAALVANNLLSRQYTAEGAVRQYLSALQAGDANKAWDAIQVATPTASVTASLTDRSALRAALATGKPDMRSFNLSQTSQIDSNTSSVAITYDTAAGSKQAKFVVQRGGQTQFGLYPVWHVVISPSILQITLPKGSAGIKIDGHTLALPDGQSTVAVLPLQHTVAFNGTGMLVTQTVPVDAFFSAGQAVGYQPQLTPAGQQQARAAITAAFASCAQGASSSPGSGSNCPQDAGLNQSTSGQWRLVGDPTQDLTFGVGQDGNPSGSGHYQMVFTYSAFDGTHQQVSAGGYMAALVLSQSDVAVSSIQGTQSTTSLQRPAGATDQAAKSAVAQALTQCAKSTADFVAGCPQQLFDSVPINISWSLTGDPLAGATVSFDPSTGIITVQGPLPMTASYSSGGVAKSRASTTTTYAATLLWDGQALQLVTIVGNL